MWAFHHETTFLLMGNMFVSLFHSFPFPAFRRTLSVSVSVQVLWEADAKMEVGIQRFIGGSLCLCKVKRRRGRSDCFRWQARSGCCERRGLDRKRFRWRCQSERVSTSPAEVAVRGLRHWVETSMPKTPQYACHWLAITWGEGGLFSGPCRHASRKETCSGLC